MRIAVATKSKHLAALIFDSHTGGMPSPDFSGTIWRVYLPQVGLPGGRQVPCDH